MVIVTAKAECHLQLRRYYRRVHNNINQTANDAGAMIMATLPVADSENEHYKGVGQATTGVSKRSLPTVRR